MGNAGKWRERERARELRARSWTLQEIADELGVAKGSVSVWVRDVEFTPQPRNRGHGPPRPHPMRVAKLAEIARLERDAVDQIGTLSERELLVFGLALYLGEGAKTEKSGVALANTSPEVMVAFLRWFRRFFDVDEARLRARIYLHEGLDIAAATTYWSDLLRIPAAQFHRPYRAVSRGGPSKHPMGCVTVRYSDASTRRRVMAMMMAVTSAVAFRDSSVGRALDC
jgi:transcriptional regulator with XRE-family HTH domain